MTFEIGPLEERESSPNLFERYARFWLTGIFGLFDHLVENPRIRYDRQDNILRLLGSSENPREEYNRASLLSLGVMIVWACCYTLMIIADGLLVLLLAIIAVPAILGSYNAWRYCEIIDHTHAKIETEAVEELQEQFTAGEIDQEEFEEQLEQEFEA